MASVEVVFGYPGLRIGYTANSALVGGQLVERLNGTNLVQVAGAASLKVCGVALDDVPASAAWVGQPIVAEVNAATVVRRCVIPVTFVGAANPGDRLIAAATGKVSAIPAVDASSLATLGTGLTNTRAIVGEAFEAAADGETKLAVIY